MIAIRPSKVSWKCGVVPLDYWINNWYSEENGVLTKTVWVRQEIALVCHVNVWRNYLIVSVIL